MKYVMVFASLWFYVASGGLSGIASIITNDIAWLSGLYYLGIEQLLITPAHAG